MKPGELCTGLVSWFGGPQDAGVSWTEGLALYEPEDVPEHPELFMSPEDVRDASPVRLCGPLDALGLARRLRPEALYCACRWDYEITPRAMLRSSLVEVWPSGQELRRVTCIPVDWGPHERTGRIIDVSFGALQKMECATDDMVCVRLITPADRAVWDVSR